MVPEISVPGTVGKGSGISVVHVLLMRHCEGGLRSGERRVISRSNRLLDSWDLSCVGGALANHRPAFLFLTNHSAVLSNQKARAVNHII